MIESSLNHLFVGVVNSRNIWANDLSASLSVLESLESIVGKDKLIVSTSCTRQWIWKMKKILTVK